MGIHERLASHRAAVSSCPRRSASARDARLRRRSASHRPDGASDAGFTLVEALVATLVLTVGLLAIAALLAVTAQMHVGSRESARSTRIAQDKVDELLKRTFSTDPSIAPGGSLDDDEDNYSESPETGVNVRWVVADGPTDDTRWLTVRVVNTHSQHYRNTDVKTLIRQW